MQANEIRVGNLVCDKHGKQILIESIAGYGINVSCGDGGVYAEYTLDEIFCISLDEEWLIKFGFKRSVYKDRDNDDYVLWEVRLFSFYELYDKSFAYATYIKGDGQFKGGKLIEYVHSLQNLYYALTSEELTIKTQ